MLVVPEVLTEELGICVVSVKETNPEPEVELVTAEVDGS